MHNEDELDFEVLVSLGFEFGVMVILGKLVKELTDVLLNQFLLFVQLLKIQL